ncbi:hypothetical protein ACFQ9Z_30370 [Streptomyces sp. NPDC056580]|uniref:hypothetical protein n=1 Tax=Streptomyces sp. NPDC056580 TaxID=3345872 RepID=UPI0036B29466
MKYTPWALADAARVCQAYGTEYQRSEATERDPLEILAAYSEVKRASRPTVRPFNPVAPAFANTLLDATGVLLGQLPLSRDRVWLVVRDAGLTDRQVGDSWWNAPCQPTCCTLIASLTRTVPAARTSR